jgi:DNA invertase Pin-like site-specific DNA recombinase
MELGYARVSTDDQRLDLQLDALNKAGCAEIFKDVLSGARADRPELERCLNRLRPGDVLVVWKLDRLGRNLHHLIGIIQELSDRGIGFKSLTENIDTTNVGGKLQFHIFGALGEFERAIIIERTKAGKEAAKARGKFLGGNRLLGEEPRGEKAKATITPQQVTAERALLQELAGRVLNGESLSAIIRDLKTQGIPTASGGNWSVHTLRRALTSPRTTPFLGDDLHRNLQRLFANPQARKRQGKPSRYLLTGIIRCQCGARMYINLQAAGEGRPRYRCLHSLDINRCRKVSVLAAPLESYVTRETIRWLAGPGLVVVRNRLLQLDRDLTQTAKRMHEDEKELEELARLKGQGRYTIKEWLALRDPIEERIKAAREALDKQPAILALTNLPETRKELEEAWPTWDIAKRRQILKASIARLVIHQTQQRGPVFDEGRVDLRFVSDVSPFERYWATEQANGAVLHQVAGDLDEAKPE